MDQIKDSIADQHFRRRRTQQTKIRCFLGCFGGGGASEEDEKLPQRKFKSINQSRSWFSCLKLRSKKSPKRTVPVESQSATDEKKFNHEKGRCVLGRSKSKSVRMRIAYDELPAKGDDEILNQLPVANAGRSKSKSNKMISACDELPAKGDDEILNQPPVAGEVQHGKANIKTRSAGKGIFLRNSKSMNHIELLEPIIKENPTCKLGATRSSLRKSKSAKTTTTTTTLINQPAGVGSQLIRPNTTELSLSLSLSLSQSDVAEQQPAGRNRGENGVDDENRVLKKTDEKKKKGGGSNIDRVVGISIIVMVLLIMAVWGKLCAILCSSAWLYFYPLLLRANNNNNNNIKNGTQLNVVGQSQTKESDKSLQLVHGNSQLQKKKVVFEGFLQRDHQIL